MTHKEVGNWGEQKACEFLQKLGYKLIERNIYCRYGEIDLLFQDGEYLVFVEVKTRKNITFGNPSEFVSKSKQQKLMKSAMIYINQIQSDVAIRFDVIEVLYAQKNKIAYVTEINHIKQAFWEES